MNEKVTPLKIFCEYKFILESLKEKKGPEVRMVGEKDGSRKSSKRRQNNKNRLKY